MSEISKASLRAEITVRNLKTRKVSIHSGRFGTFADAYEAARKQGFELLQYVAIY